MKNLVLLVSVLLMSSNSFAGECNSLGCNRPTGKTVSKAANVTRNIVTVPSKILNKTIPKRKTR